MGKMKNYEMEMQEQAYLEELEYMETHHEQEDYEVYDIDDRLAEENAQRLAEEILTYRHTVTEEATGFKRKIYKVNIDKIKELFPAQDGGYLDWYAFMTGIESIMYGIKDNDHKKALERLLDSKYTTRLRWLPPAVGIRVD